MAKSSKSLQVAPTMQNMEWEDQAAMDKSAADQMIDHRYDLINRRAYYSGSRCRDYLTHVLNEHPLLSIFAGDPEHPYTKLDRIGVFVVVTTLGIIPVGLMAVLRCDKHRGASDIAQDRHDECIQNTRYAAFIVIGLPLMAVQYIIEYSIYFEAVFGFSGDTSSWSCCRCCYNSCSGCFKFLKTAFFCFTLFLSFVFVVIVVLLDLVWNSGFLDSDVMWLLGTIRLQTLGLWFVFDLFMPCIGFCSKWKSDRNHYVWEAYEERKAKKKADKAAAKAGQSAPVNPDLVDMDPSAPPPLASQPANAAASPLVEP